MDKAHKQTLLQIIASHSNREATTINKNDRFHEDYGLDSIDAVQLIAAINKKFNIKLNDDEIQHIQTVKDMITKVNLHLNQAAK